MNGGRVVDEERGQLWGEELKGHKTEQGKGQGEGTAQSEGGPALFLLSGGIVVGQQGKQTIGDADGKIQGKLIQLFDG